MQGCEKNPESRKNLLKPFAEVVESNVLDTDTSEQQFAMFAGMPEEIIKDHIMTKLNDKSFLQFACTCKQLGNLAKTGFNPRLEENKKVQREFFMERIEEHGEALGLNGIGLKTIYPGAFDSPEFGHVEVVFLGHNNLTKLDKDTFKGLTKLTTLRLGHNKLTNLDKDAFNGLNKLKALILNNNNIKHFDIDILLNLEKLKTIDLKDNPVTHETQEKIKNLFESRNQTKRSFYKRIQSMQSYQELKTGFERIGLEDPFAYHPSYYCEIDDTTK